MKQETFEFMVAMGVFALLLIMGGLGTFLIDGIGV